LALFALVSCGGGSSSTDCKQTGDVTYAYNSVPLDPKTRIHVLAYKLGQTNTWALTINGVSEGCLAGLKVVARSDLESVPSGFILDQATGKISSPLMTQHVEIDCVTTTGTITGKSVNRICPAGQTLTNRQVTVLKISSNFIDSKGEVNNTALTYAPKP
jgi:hypothetical protein